MGCRHFDGIDFTGNDLNAGGLYGRIKGHLPSWQACRGACEGFPGCKSWAFDKVASSGDNCAVKGTTLAQGEINPRDFVVSGEPCSSNRRRLGDDEVDLNAKSSVPALNERLAPLLTETPLDTETQRRRAMPRCTTAKAYYMDKCHTAEEPLFCPKGFKWTTSTGYGCCNDNWYCFGRYKYCKREGHPDCKGAWAREQAKKTNMATLCIDGYEYGILKSTAGVVYSFKMLGDIKC